VDSTQDARRDRYGNRFRSAGGAGRGMVKGMMLQHRFVSKELGRT
jgi:hypothetical protein